MTLTDEQVRKVADALLQSNTPTIRSINTSVPWAERLIDCLTERGLVIVPKRVWGKDPSGRWK